MLIVKQPPPVQNMKVSVIKMFLQHLLVILSTLVLPKNEAQQSCCQTKRVSGLGSLDGVYTLMKQLHFKLEPICEDGCLYTRQDQPDDWFCFKPKYSMHSVSCSDTNSTYSTG